MNKEFWKSMAKAWCIRLSKEDAERIAGVVEEHIKAKRKERLYSKNPLIDLGDDEEDDEY